MPTRLQWASRWCMPGICHLNLDSWTRWFIRRILREVASAQCNMTSDRDGRTWWYSYYTPCIMQCHMLHWLCHMLHWLQAWSQYSLRRNIRLRPGILYIIYLALGFGLLRKFVADMESVAYRFSKSVASSWGIRSRLRFFPRIAVKRCPPDLWMRSSRPLVYHVIPCPQMT